MLTPPSSADLLVADTMHAVLSARWKPMRTYAQQQGVLLGLVCGLVCPEPTRRLRGAPRSCCAAGCCQRCW